MDLGPLEIIVVLAVVIIIFGVGKLPQVGGALGKSIREFRKASSEEGDEDARKIEQQSTTTPPAQTASRWNAFCTQCGTRADPGLRFCTVCGHSLLTAPTEETYGTSLGTEEQTSSALPSRNAFCAQCGAHVSASLRFCTTCGHQL
jgi:sec-independent protein translocase protein TatA